MSQKFKKCSSLCIPWSKWRQKAKMIVNAVQKCDSYWVGWPPDLGGYRNVTGTGQSGHQCWITDTPICVSDARPILCRTGNTCCVFSRFTFTLQMREHVDPERGDCSRPRVPCPYGCRPLVSSANYSFKEYVNQKYICRYGAGNHGNAEQEVWLCCGLAEPIVSSTLIEARAQHSGLAVQL